MKPFDQMTEEERQRTVIVAGRSAAATLPKSGCVFVLFVFSTTDNGVLFSTNAKPNPGAIREAAHQLLAFAAKQEDA